MTCLVAWIGVDSRGQTSCYLAADSRFSWSQSGAQVWNHGRKVFCSRKSPDIWGYYGDVMFPSTVIGQIIEAVDEELLVLNEDSQSLFERAFREQLQAYPRKQIREFGVLHCRRGGEKRATKFGIRHLRWGGGSGWKSNNRTQPNHSEVVGCFGSGSGEFKQWASRFTKSEVGGTSRAVFQAFCRMLEEGKDPLVGGAPQIASLIRVGNGRQHGVVWKGSAWLGGLRLSKGNFQPSIEFFNERFERCNPKTLNRLLDAQSQPLPSPIPED